MALQNPITRVIISLSTSAVTRAGFGTPLFASAHSRFGNRVRSYTSIEAVAEDFPTTSSAYIAANAAFSQPSRPSVFKIGRREATLTLTPTGVADGVEYTVDVEVNDGDSVSVSYTAGALDDEEAVVDALKAAIDGDAPVAAHVTTTKVGAGSSAVLEIVATNPGSGDFFFISNLTANLGESYASTETAADLLTALRDEDDDFYFVMAEDHTTAFITAMAVAVEAVKKIYFFSSQDPDSINNAYAVTETDALAAVRTSAYFRTSGLWHHEADTKYPEAAFVGYFAPKLAGSVVWANKVLSGISAAQNPATGNLLTATQRTNLENRRANTVTIPRRSPLDNGIVREGKVAAGEWIDIIRGRDNLEEDLEANLADLLINTPDKIPYTDDGINRVVSVVRTTLERYVDRGFILGNFKIDVPKARDIPFATKATRVLQDLTFRAQLQGAIVIIDPINGNLTLEELE